MTTDRVKQGLVEVRTGLSPGWLSSMACLCVRGASLGVAACTIFLLLHGATALRLSVLIYARRVHFYSNAPCLGASPVRTAHPLQPRPHLRAVDASDQVSTISRRSSCSIRRTTLFVYSIRACFDHLCMRTYMCILSIQKYRRQCHDAAGFEESCGVFC
jgi:hypothetical protein